MAQIIPAPDLRELCTLRVGGAVKRFYRATDRTDLTTAVSVADRSGVELLVLGGGSNLVPPDDGFDGLIVQDARSGVSVVSDPADLRRAVTNSAGLAEPFPDSADFAADAVLLRADAGVTWDRLVEYAVSQGFSGIEMLSGIPGTVGAAPVQNIGAYGGEIGDVLLGIVAWDREAKRISYLPREALELGYRDSVLKRSRVDWGATGRWVVLEVDLMLRRGGMSVPVAYGQLATYLDVEVGARVPLAEARSAVLDLRQSKGMILDPEDHDTWSVGSFFVNPVVAGDAPVLARLGAEAPRWPVASAGAATGAGFMTGLDVEVDADVARGAAGAGIGTDAKPGAGADVGTGTDFGAEAKPGVASGAGAESGTVSSARTGVDSGVNAGAVKLSAAWLISHSGIEKGFALPGSAAAVSGKHVLALVNRGGATSAQIHELADYIIAQVEAYFGLTLVPEPVML